MTMDDFTSQLANGVTNFSGADLHGVDFSHLCLEGLNFKDANLSDCIFWLTSLTKCNLENADLSGVSMRRTMLYKVNLTNANLDNASIDADEWLDEIEIDANTMDKYFPSVCPSKGEFVGWKKAFVTVNENISYSVIVKLLIPSDAKRGSAFGRKCRCDKARVLGVECLRNPGKLGIIAHSIFDETFKYELGKEVLVDYFDGDRSHECAPGIHFFMTREEAANY